MGVPFESLSAIVLSKEAEYGQELSERLRELGCRIKGVTNNPDQLLERIIESKPELVFLRNSGKDSFDQFTLARRINESSKAHCFFVYENEDDLPEDTKAFYSDFGFIKNPINLVNLASEIIKILRIYSLKADYESANNTAEYYRLVADNSGDWIFWLSPENEIIYSSPSVEKMLGYDVDYFIKKSDRIVNIVREDYRKRFVWNNKEKMQNTPIHCMELPMTSKDGKERWIEHLCKPAFSNKGDFLGRIASNRDITYKKKVEGKLKYKTEMHDLAQELALLGHWELDIQSDKLTWSNVIYKIFGLDKDKYNPSYFKFINLIHPKDRIKVVNAFRRSMAAKDKYDIQHRIVTPQGEIRYVHEQGKHVYDQFGFALKTIGTVQDITRLKLAEMEKTKIEKQLRQTYKMESLGALAGGITHDFNNMLSVITGYTELALEEAKSEKIRVQDLEKILDAAKRANTLVRKILTFSRDVEPELESVDLNTKIINSVEMLRRIIPKMVDIKLALSSKACLVKADSSQLEQVIVNLGVNAKDAMPNGGKMTFSTEKVVLNESFCKNRPGCIPGEYICLEVTDNGMGMDEETLNNIFQPFFTTKKKGKGTGLGLAVVFGIIKSHKGYITCRSKTNQGTSFSLFFPALNEIKKVKKVKEVENNQEYYGCETILIVEDDLAIMHVADRMLSKNGYQTFLAESGEEAEMLYKVNSNSIDLVVMDIIMPGMGGHKCIEKILNINPTAKIIAMSGSTNDMEPFENKLKAFVAKPFRHSDLLKVVRRVLDDN